MPRFKNMDFSRHHCDGQPWLRRTRRNGTLTGPGEADSGSAGTQPDKALSHSKGPGLRCANGASGCWWFRLPGAVFLGQLDIGVMPLKSTLPGSQNFKNHPHDSAKSHYIIECRWLWRLPANDFISRQCRIDSETSARRSVPQKRPFTLATTGVLQEPIHSAAPFSPLAPPCSSACQIVWPFVAPIAVTNVRSPGPPFRMILSS